MEIEMLPCEETQRNRYGLGRNSRYARIEYYARST